MNLNNSIQAMIAKLGSIVSALQSIGSDTTPVPVQAQLKSGNYAYSTIGAPSVNVSDKIVYSDSFQPSGEKIIVAGTAYATNGCTVDTSGGIWLECDPSGGTAYKPVLGTYIKFSDIPTAVHWNRNFCAQFDCKGGNCRIAINGGTLTGTGVYGWNMVILN